MTFRALSNPATSRIVLTTLLPTALILTRRLHPTYRGPICKDCMTRRLETLYGKHVEHERPTWSESENEKSRLHSKQQLTSTGHPEDLRLPMQRTQQHSDVDESKILAQLQELLGSRTSPNETHLEHTVDLHPIRTALADLQSRKKLLAESISITTTK